MNPSTKTSSQCVVVVLVCLFFECKLTVFALRKLGAMNSVFFFRAEFSWSC